jgi:hypothetical protein
MIDYEIQASTHRCFATGRELRVGEKYFSVLLEVEGKMVRHDYATEAWQGPPPGAFSFWMSKVVAPTANRKPPIDEEMLMDCFQRLDGQGEASRIRFRYVLALLLMRRKLFRFEEVRQEAGQELLILRYNKTGAEYPVVNPCLTEPEMVTVQDEVLQALGWD